MRNNKRPNLFITKHPRQQHIVPRAYLARFENDEDTLWAYERGKKPRPSTAKSEATQRDYFEVKIRGEETNFSLEETLRKLEEKAGPAFHALIERKPLRDEDIAPFALYVASLFLRSRKVRDGQMTQFSETAEAELSSSPRLREHQYQFYLRTGSLVPMEEIRKAFLNVANKFSDRAFRHVQAIKNNTPSIASRLTEKDWHVVDSAPSSYFLTSDAPVLSYIIDDGRLYTGYGWGREDSQVALPLTPTKLFVAVPRGTQICQQYDEVSTETLNRTITAFADRFVYSHKESQETANLVESTMASVSFGVNAFVAPAPVSS